MALGQKPWPTWQKTPLTWRRKTATATVRFAPSDPEKISTGTHYEDTSWKLEDKYKSCKPTETLEFPRLIINGRDGESYLQYNPSFLHAIRAPLYMCDIRPDRYDIIVTVHGGGLKSQAEAIASAVATLSLKAELEQVTDHQRRSEESRTKSKTLKRTFRSLGLLTSDPRRKERKKYGLKKARKASQYSKR